MTRILLAVLLAAAVGSAAAQTVTVTKDTGETETAQTTAQTTVQTSEADTPREPARTCLRSTGSRVITAQNLRAEKAGKPQRCGSGVGRVYTAEDLERSGHLDLADALRALDTSIR
jgi:hypothetical protein